MAPIVAIQAANARLKTRSEVMARGRVYGGWSNLWRVQGRRSS
jgi:hypothetical protein